MNNDSYDLLNHLKKAYNLRITEVKKFNTVYKVKTNKQTFILKRLKNNRLINNYNYLLSQKFHNFILPIRTKQNSFVTKYNNYSYYLSPYIQNIEYPLDKRLIDYIDLLSKLHTSTNIKKKFNKDKFKNIYQKQIKHLLRRFEIIDYFLTECETSNNKSIFMWHFLMNYNDLIYTKKILSEIQNKIDQELEKIDQFYYSLIHNNTSLDHFIVTNDKNYLISLDNSILSLKIYDYIRLYIEYCEYKVDWFSLIQHEQITDFEFYYFVYNVIYYIIINMNLTKLKNNPPYIAINNLVYDMNVIESIIKLYKTYTKLVTSQEVNE